MMKLYYWLSLLITPLLWVWLRYRAWKGKEDRTRLRERMGRVSIARPHGTLIWIHAASVGESNSVLPLIQRLHELAPSLHVVLTTGTLSSATLMNKRLPERAFHQFVPIDSPLAVGRFLRKLRPDMAIWVESEFWPNLLQMTAQQSIPLYLVNARLSERSAKRWRLARQSFLALMAHFRVIYAGSGEDKSRLHHLGVEAVEYVGNLKYDAPAPPADPVQTSEIMQNIGDRRIWLASSTHPGEEAVVAEVHQQVREVFPELLTIVVPRHPHRVEAICEAMKQHKLTVARRSKKQIILPETDLYLADTLGELGTFYRLAGVVFMGGSFIPHGGHNPIEPALLDCAILCGPHMHNFSSIVNELRKAGALIQVDTVAALSEQVVDLLRDHDRQENLATLAHEVVDAHRGAVEVISQAILSQMGLMPTLAKEAGEPVLQEGS